MPAKHREAGRIPGEITDEAIFESRRVGNAGAGSRLAAASLLADDVRYFEKDGVTYRETRQVEVRRPVVETKIEARDCTVYRDKFTTEVQDTPRSIPVAITEYHWVPVWHRPWNPFAAPYLTYQMAPQTRWETRNDTVKTSVTRRQVVPEKITQQVPVTSQRFVEDEIISRVAVSTRPAGTTPPAAVAAPAATPPADPVAGGRYGSVPAAKPRCKPGCGRSLRHAEIRTPTPNTLPPGGANQPEAIANRTAIGGVMKLDTDPGRAWHVRLAGRGRHDSAGARSPPNS